MEKIEYGDLYKFLASLGLALIVLAVVAPWLFLREPFDLQLEAGKLDGLTEGARSLILYRQQVTIALVRSVPWISGVLLLLGSTSLVAGLLGWKRSQGVLDRKQLADLVRVEKEIEKMSDEALKRKQESENVEGEVPERKKAPDQHGVGPPPIDELKPKVERPRTNRYGRVESLLIDRLGVCLQDDYFCQDHRQIGRAQFDLVLRAKNENADDLVVEVKVSDYPLDWRYVRANLLKVIYLSELYTNALKRRSLPVLYFVAPESILSESDTFNLEQRSRHEAKRLGVEAGLKFLSEENLPTLECRQLATPSFIGAKHGRASA